MDYLIATSLVLLNAVWLILVILGLPGTWLMVVSTVLVAWWRWDATPAPMFTLGPLIVIAVLALIGELLEFGAGVVGTKVAGGSKRSAVGALVGTLVGGIIGTFAIPVPLLGSLIGACLGAALGAWGVELVGGRPMRESLKSGAGAGVGRLAGTLVKLVAGALIWLVVAVAAFWP
jgi:uncharacterized protein YqgC (DUF456 family)